MSRITAKMIAILAIASGLAFWAPMARAQLPTANITYFDFDGGDEFGPEFAGSRDYTDGTVNIMNPNFISNAFATATFECANTYVFDNKQNLIECCGCPVTNFGLRTLDEESDLASNPINGGHYPDGAILVVDSGANNPNAGSVTCDLYSVLFPGFPFVTSSSWPASVIQAAASCNPCDPALANVATPGVELQEYATHGTNGGRDIGESNFLPTAYTAPTFASLEKSCAAIHTGGTGRGICTCGTGDFSAASAAKTAR